MGNNKLKLHKPNLNKAKQMKIQLWKTFLTGFLPLASEG